MPSFRGGCVSLCQLALFGIRGERGVAVLLLDLLRDRAALAGRRRHTSVTHRPARAVGARQPDVGVHQRARAKHQVHV